MLEVVTRFVQPIVQIRRGEWRKSVLMFLYFAFTIATLYILKPVRSSLFLTTHGAEKLRYAYLGEGIFLILITFGYVTLSKWIKQKNILFSSATGFFASNIFVFWLLFKAGYVDRLAYFFYIWVAAFSITIVTQCWTLANDIFNPQEAKRLFGFIISGGSLGGIIGGVITNRSAERIGTENLLLLAGILLSACIVLINAIWKHERSAHPEDDKGGKRAASSAAHLREKSTWQLFFGSRYLLLIAVLVMVAKICSTIVDNQFNSVVEAAVLEKNARTAFFGGFMALLNGVSFFLQLIIASYALRYFGIGISLLLLPIGLCLGSLATIFFPILSVATATKIYDGSLNYSINQLSKEILYLPIPSRIRYRVKPLIDMLAYRFSKTVAGLLIILVTPLLGIPDEKLGLVVLLIAPLWILAAWSVRDEYMQSIKTLLSNPRGITKALRQTAQDATNILLNLKGERSVQELKEFLVHRSSVTRKMSAAACFAFYSSARDMRRVRKLVEEMVRYEALELKGIDVDRLFHEQATHENGFFDRRLIDLLKAKHDPQIDFKALLEQQEGEILARIQECLNNPEEEMNSKRKAILISSTLGTQGAADFLLDCLIATHDRSLRFECIRALNRIRAKGEKREFNTSMIKKEVMNEIKEYKSILTALEEYKDRRLKGYLRDDYLLAALQAILEESLERVFRLLALLYDSDIIHVIYDRLVEIDPDKHVKANALELLENVVEPELYRALYPVFDETQWEGTQKKGFDEIIEEFLTSGDRWLTICAVFLIVELGLVRFYTRLEEIGHSQVPIVREAAEIASVKMKRKR